MLADVVKQIRLAVDDALSDVHTALPGTIKSIDSATGRATVQPAGKFKTSGGKTLEFPAISGVPLVFQTGSSQSVGIVFPVKPGDGCLLIISEQALDEWLYDGESSSDFKHDLTNAIAIPGLFVKANKMVRAATGSDSVIVYAGEKQIVVAKSGITIKGNLTVEGTITASDAVASGISLKNHVHTSAMSGQDTSKPK